MCVGVAPDSYSGLMCQAMIRARDKIVILLDGIISKESSKTVPDPRPIFLTPPARVRLLHRTYIIYHRLLGPFWSLSRGGFRFLRLWVLVLSCL
jgi:hypothetical protein